MAKMRALVPALLMLGLVTPALAHEAEPAEDSATCRLIRGADTEDTADDVPVCRKDVWFHQAENKAGNLAALGQDRYPSWDTTAPIASVTSGAGGGYAASSALHQSGSPWDDRGSATFEGTFTGNIDTLAATLYLFTPVETARGEPFGTSVRIVMDGKEIYSFTLPMPLQAGGQAAKKVQFAVTDLYPLLELEGLQGDKPHALRFQVHGEGLGTEAAVFVYDTSEVPSGMVFNIEPEKLTDAYTVVSAWSG